MFFPYASTGNSEKKITDLKILKPTNVGLSPSSNIT